jgi:Chemotaxis phosphatase CheX
MEMNTTFEAALREAAPRILEDAAFLFPDDLPSEARPGAVWNPLGAKLAFEGNGIRGILLVWADPAMVRVLAANMLGLEEDDPQTSSRMGDALAELLNMVAGNTLTEAWGTRPVFHVGIPELLDPSQWPQDCAREGAWISAEGHPLVFMGECR